MKFVRKTDDIQGLTVLSAEREEGDYAGSAPIPNMNIDWVPRKPLSEERVLVAACLWFSETLSGTITVGSAVQLGTESALRRFLKDPEFRVSITSMNPRSPLPGGATLVIDGPGWEGEPQLAAPPMRLIASFPNAAERTGASFQQGTFTIPTNARNVPSTDSLSDLFKYYSARIAVAILMATEYSIGFFSLPNVLRDHPQWTELVDVLKSVDIGVITG